MRLKEKFELGQASSTYQRIDNKNLVDIYVGYNDEHKMSLVIAEESRNYAVKSTKVIDVTTGLRTDGKSALSFNLIDDSYEPIFLVLCDDLIKNCERQEKGKAISYAIHRWKYWKSMFEGRKSQLLSENEIKGLLGELLFIENQLDKGISESELINSWMGPLYGRKDFEIGETWYEIKALNNGTLEVSINSLQQLESQVDGHLVLVYLDKTSVENRLAISLNDIILRIYTKLQDLDTIRTFMQKLNDLGYYHSPEYDKIKYIFSDIKSYVVKEGFPRIRRKNIEEAITKIKYSILIDKLSEFQEEQ